MKQISIIGDGSMGMALAVGLAAAGYKVIVSGQSQTKLDVLSKINGIIISNDAQEAVSDADMLILAMRSAQYATAIAEIGTVINYNRTIIASLSTDFALIDLEQMFAPYNKAPMLVRTMPNTAVAVAKSMTFMSLNRYSEPYKSELVEVFSSVGSVEFIQEPMMKAATLLCTCGIAFAYRYIRAASEGGVALGFEADEACRYICQTISGAVAFLQASGMHPEVAIDHITAPAGLTIKGLNEMEKAGFSASVIAGYTMPDSK